MIEEDWGKLDKKDQYIVFEQWLKEITGMGYWSVENPKGQCIHWKSFQAASEDKFKEPQFLQPGCYLFGWGSECDDVRLRYVGCTGTSLKKRITNRYLPSKRSKHEVAIIKQFPLAAYLAANNNEWRGLPDHTLITHFNGHGAKRISEEIKRRKRLCQSNEEIADYVRKHADPTLRIKHATNFAGYLTKYGTDKIWVALIPQEDGEQARVMKLEQSIINVVSEWNEAHNHPILLNNEYPSDGCR